MMVIITDNDVQDHRMNVEEGECYYNARHIITHAENMEAARPVLRRSNQLFHLVTTEDHLTISAHLDKRLGRRKSGETRRQNTPNERGPNPKNRNRFSVTKSDLITRHLANPLPAAKVYRLEVKRVNGESVQIRKLTHNLTVLSTTMDDRICSSSLFHDP